MALTLINTGDTINAAALNQVLQALLVPAGGQETGHYKISGNMYQSSLFISTYVHTISRGATPVSVTVDTSDDTPSNVGGITTGQFTAGGFQVFCSNNSGAASLEGHVAGNYTANY